MKTEELQMILNALQSVGDGAKDAFIWWLVMDKGLPVVGWLLTVDRKSTRLNSSHT